MTYRDTHAARRALSAIGARQGGYVTTRQAAEAGYGGSHLSYHLSTGMLQRVGHGLYRLMDIPPHEHDDLIRLALWSCNRSGEPQAVVSHESALMLHDLSDVLPAVTHLTVPPRFRKPAPAGCVLHTAKLGAEDRQSWTVFEVTTPARTLADAAASTTIPQEQLELAVSQAIERGVASASDLTERAERDPSGRLARALASAKRGATRR